MCLLLELNKSVRTFDYDRIVKDLNVESCIAVNPGNGRKIQPVDLYGVNMWKIKILNIFYSDTVFEELRFMTVR